MSDERELRLEAGRNLAAELARPETRALFARNGYASGRPVVVALDSDSVQDTIARVAPYKGPVALAVYDHTQRSFRFMGVGIGDRQGTNMGDVGGTASVGMLVDAAVMARRATFKMTAEQGTPSGVADYEVLTFA